MKTIRVNSDEKLFTHIANDNGFKQNQKTKDKQTVGYAASLFVYQ